MKKYLLLACALLSLVTLPQTANAGRIKLNVSFVEVRPEPYYRVVERVRVARPYRYAHVPRHHYRHRHYSQYPVEYYETSYGYVEPPYYYAPRYDVFQEVHHWGYMEDDWGW